MNECGQFPENSRQREICEGKANLPLGKINRYRERWGLRPLGEAEVAAYVPAVAVARPDRPMPMLRARKQPVKRRGVAAGTKAKHGGCTGCGGGKTRSTPKPNGFGPGSQLLKLFESAGIPHCEECFALAGRMDRWGKDGCRREIKTIVEDILPRAKEWMESHQWIMHRLLSLTGTEDSMLRVAIKKKVYQAIKQAEDRPRRRSVPHRFPHRAGINRAEDVSNLLESTLIKPPEWIKGTHPTIGKLPVSSDPTRHLLYHVYPRRGDFWKWNVDLLLPHLPLFNGRRIVAIAIDNTTVDAEEVKASFRGEVLEFMVFRNNEQAKEMVSFLPLLAQVQTDDPDVVTFRAHAKGTQRLEKDRREHLKDWIELLYTVNLADWGQVRRDLEEAAMTGACRKFDQFRKRPPAGKPTYSGSFYWFRNCYVYSRAWQDIDTLYWGCESWPAKLFTKEETQCLLIDDTKSMYDPNYWRKHVLPEYERWREERGVL